MLKKIFKANDVVTIKLVSGEEVIGYYVSQDADEIILRKPVVPVATAEGKMLLAPYIMSSDYLREQGGELPFSKMATVTTVVTSKSFRDVYVSQVSGFDPSIGSSSGLITT